MSGQQEVNIAIIGAGLSGLALALSLHAQGIKSTIYESRLASLNIGGAIMLSPNALKILDRLGIYQQILPHSYVFDEIHFRNETDTIVDTFAFGGKNKFGYAALRVYRHVLIRELLRAVTELGIPVLYGKEFAAITKEGDKGVSWSFEDGTESTATHLIGTDGIHSRVRRYLYPDSEPTFTGMAGITARIPKSALQLPANYHIPVTIMNKKHGAFVIAPQLSDGSEVLIGKQFRAGARDRAGWDALYADPQNSIDFLKAGVEDYGRIVQHALEYLSRADKQDISSGINIWPFYIVPKLEKWMSDSGRIGIMGDAAHAIPPTAGQGVNQAFEDVYTFALVFARARAASKEQVDQNAPHEVIQRAFKAWQEGRQERVDGVLKLNETMNLRRLPDSEGGQGGVEAVDVDWLYNVDFERTVSDWLA